MQKAGLAGRACVYRKLTAGLVSQVVLFFPLHICSYLLGFAKIGSSVSVEMLHFCIDSTSNSVNKMIQLYELAIQI